MWIIQVQKVKLCIAWTKVSLNILTDKEIVRALRDPELSSVGCFSEEILKIIDIFIHKFIKTGIIAIKIHWRIFYILYSQRSYCFCCTSQSNLISHSFSMKTTEWENKESVNWFGILTTVIISPWSCDPKTKIKLIQIWDVNCHMKEILREKLRGTNQNAQNVSAKSSRRKLISWWFLPSFLV